MISYISISFRRFSFHPFNCHQYDVFTQLSKCLRVNLLIYKMRQSESQCICYVVRFSYQFLLIYWNEYRLYLTRYSSTQKLHIYKKKQCKIDKIVAKKDSVYFTFKTVHVVMLLFIFKKEDGVNYNRSQWVESLTREIDPKQWTYDYFETLFKGGKI